MNRGNFRTNILVDLANADPATVYSSSVPNEWGRGIHVIIDLTARVNANLTVTLQGQDGAGVWYDILSSTALAAVATTSLKAFVGATAAANLVANDFLPAQWRIKAVVASSGATPKVTATISANVLA
jgi:hypothetical protein